MQSIWPLCFLAVLGPARLYDVTVETGMPHLEENLRYAITRTEQCLARQDLDSVFPVLQHSSPSSVTAHLERRARRRGGLASRSFTARLR
jgi:hypothetical protein